MTAHDIKYLVIHCTAGFGSITSIEKYWKDKLRWRGKGYQIIIDLQGEAWYIKKDGSGYTKKLNESNIFQVTNGVRGYNDKSIHISYIGGVDKDDYSIAKDTRTEDQKAGILNAIFVCVNEIRAERGEMFVKDIKIQGHRDFSPDKNGNGVVDPWERIKECPSFSAIEEYNWITA